MWKRMFMISLCVMFGLQFAGTGSAREEIVWPYPCYYPLWVCDGDAVTGGLGLEIQTLLWERMPEYTHTLAQLPVQRMLEDVKNGSHALLYGFYKTPEREQYMHFSLPCRISLPTMVVTRKGDLARFGGGSAVSLKNLLEDRTLRFLRLDAVSFGTGLDMLLQEYQEAEHVFIEYRTDNLDEYALELLLNKRVDYILSVDSTIYAANQAGIADDIAMIPITEKDEYTVGYVVAPKNEWGRQIIERVNAVLRQEIPTDHFFEFFAPLVTQEMLPELRRQFNSQIVTPAAQ